jgi:hypothetical protein
VEAHLILGLPRPPHRFFPGQSLVGSEIFVSGTLLGDFIADSQ